MTTAYHTKTVLLTQNYWTKILDTDTMRDSVTLRSTHPTAEVSYQFCHFPYALDFDGTDDYGSVAGSWMLAEDGTPIIMEDGAPLVDEDTDDFVTLLQDDESGSVQAHIKLDEVVHTADRCIFSVGKAGAAYYMEFGVDTNGYLYGKLYNNSTLEWHVMSSCQLDTDWHVVKIVHNATLPKLHVDGHEILNRYEDETDPTQWLSDLGTNLDVVYVGTVDTGSGATNFFKGLIHSLKIKSGVDNSGEIVGLWLMKDAPDAVIGTVDQINAYAIELKGSGEPAWASYEPGEYAPPGTEWNNPAGVPVREPCWGLTTAANVYVRAAWASRGPLQNM